jgi:hypothetical protein
MGIRAILRTSMMRNIRIYRSQKLTRQQRRALQRMGEPAEGDLFEYAKNFAVKEFTANGSFAPARFFIDTEHGRRILLIAPMPQRELQAEYYAFIRDQFRDAGVLQYASINELWTAPGSGWRPSEHPERREALQVALADRFGHSQLAIADIKRDSSGTPTLQWWVEGEGPAWMPVFSLLDTVSAGDFLQENRNMTKKWDRVGIPAEGDLFEYAKDFAVEVYGESGFVIDRDYIYITDTKHGRRIRAGFFPKERDRARV